MTKTLILDTNVYLTQVSSLFAFGKSDIDIPTIILDEMHHVSNPTFSKVIDTNYCRYKLGLSGTIERMDVKHVVFRDYFGNKVIKTP